MARSAGVFNPDKLLWLNEQYIKTGDPDRLGGLVAEILAGQGVDVNSGPDLAAVVRTLQDRAKTLVEMAAGARFYFVAPDSYDEEAAAKFLTADQRDLLELTVRHLEALPEYSHDSVEGAFRGVMQETGLKFGKIGPTIRVALVGGTVSPSIYDVVAVLGRERVLSRLRKALATLG